MRFILNYLDLLKRAANMCRIFRISKVVVHSEFYLAAQVLSRHLSKKTQWISAGLPSRGTPFSLNLKRGIVYRRVNFDRLRFKSQIHGPHGL